MAWFYELRPKQLLCWSKQRFSRPYCNLLWRFDQLLGSGLIFKIFNSQHIIASEKSANISRFYFGIKFIIDPSSFFLVLIKTLLRPQSTMEYLYLILERKILLLYYCGMHHCLIIFIFILEISRLFLPDCFLGISNLWSWKKLLDGSWIQPKWCARNQAMLIYLVMTSLIFAGISAYCFLLLAGAAGQCKRNESRGVFYQSLKIMRLRFIYLFVSLAYTFKRHG